MDKFRKIVELAANVAILVVAVLLCAVLLKSQFAGSPPPGVAAPSPNADRMGEKIDLPGVDWQKNGHTLVLALSTSCHFCTESAPFYQRLVKKGTGARLIAVVPQGAVEGRAYLDRLNVPIGDVRQMPLGAIGVDGTPTLMLVDDKGVILNSWVGKLPASTEDEVLSKIG